MARPYVDLSADERSLLCRHWSFYRALDQGSQAPTTDAQKRFVGVCRGTQAPKSLHEIAYVHGRRLLELTRLAEQELIDRGFTIDLRDIKDIPIVEKEHSSTVIKYHTIDVDRFSAERRIVRRHNW